jgi:hypothetical protein
VKTGQIVVDKAMGPGADKATLGEALAAALDGDVILVRPGVYSEKLTVSKSVQIVGAGAQKNGVVIECKVPLTLDVLSGSVLIKNLTIDSASSPGSAALAVEPAAIVELQDVSLSATGQGLRVSGGRAALARSDIAAQVAVLIEQRGGVRIAHGQLSGTDAAVLMKGDGMTGDFVDVKFYNSERALNVEGKSQINVDSSEFSLKGPGGGIFAFAGALVGVKKSRFELNHLSQAGIFIQDATVTVDGTTISGSKGGGIVARRGATVNLDQVELSDNEWAGLVVRDSSRVRATRTKITNNLDCAVYIDGATVLLDAPVIKGNRCGVAFYGAGKLDSRNGTYSDNKLGSVVVKPGQEGGALVSGTGNKGLATSDQPSSPKSTQQSSKYFTGGHLTGNAFGGDPQSWMNRLH